MIERNLRIMKRLPKGLTISEVAIRLNLGYQTARALIKEFAYKASDGRKFGQRQFRKLCHEQVDWRMSNIAIARAFKVSRELVRQVREKLKKRKVESRGRPKKYT